jgi:tyrosinase
MSIRLQVAKPGPPTNGTINLRQSVTKLTDEQLADFRRAIEGSMQLSDQRGYSYFAGWHGQPFEWCKHHDPLFLPWHRQYLHFFELSLQDVVPGVTLPWWDWTVLDSIPPSYVADQAPAGENPLLIRSVTVYQSGHSQTAPPRAPGQAPSVPALPYATAWKAAMKATSFLEFSQKIEAIHDDVHHTMIDRAWRIWQHQNPGAVPPPSIIDAKLKPNGMTVRETLEVTDLGYDYAGTADSVPGTVPAAGSGAGG